MSAQHPTKRRAKGEARERLLVEAATAAIAERGLANVRVSDIAERAGMSTGHVTYYYPSKSSLLMLAIQHSEEELHRQTALELAQIRDPWRRLYALVDLAAPHGTRDRGWVLWLEAWANAGLDEHLSKVQAELVDRWRTRLTEVIRYGCGTGAFATDDPESVSTLLSCLLDGLSVEVMLGEGTMDLARLKVLFARAAEAHLSPATSDA